MKFGKNKLAVVLGAALSFGVAGQASADVYGLSYLQVDNLLVSFAPISGGSAGLFTFSTNQDATLNGANDASSGAASCFGTFPSKGSCTGVNPVLSGKVQNAPGGAPLRGENDYTKFGAAGEYSNSEGAIVTATLVGDPSTSTKSISESNLQGGFGAQADTRVASNTNLSLTFSVIDEVEGAFSIAFDAIIDVLAQVTGGDIGIAQANSSLTVTLQKGGVTVAAWAPNGNGTVTTCGGGMTCTVTEATTSLNNTSTSDGAPNQVSGGGNYKLDVVGLTSGTYTLALAATTSTDLARETVVPVPGTLFLMGAGLLLGARATRRSKSMA